ncbi:MAG TPA: hypothetical protein VN843_10470 [Anaerolineales bacterium]|nr:hypothetical protein [Anaerolineales bacterium]
MITLRIVRGILTIIPLALLVDHIFIHPYYYGEDSLQEKIYMILGIPILLLNFWAWGASQTIESYFFSSKKENT